MKILNSNNKNFDNLLNKLLSKRKKKIQSSLISVSGIIKIFISTIKYFH